MSTNAQANTYEKGKPTKKELRGRPSMAGYSQEEQNPQGPNSPNFTHENNVGLGRFEVSGQKYYSLFSGGKDSITLAHKLDQRKQLAGVVFFDTGIHTPDIIPHIKKVCDSFDWPLKIYTPPETYEEYVLKMGFPSPKTHGWAMNHLKGRCVQKVRREFGRDTILASGIRRRESGRRKISIKNGSERWEGLRVVAPIVDMTTKEVWDYVKDNGLPLSPVYSTLHMSGDCLCGAFATMDELKLIEIFYPDTFKEIQRLEALVKIAGKTKRIRERYCRWGNKGTVATKEQTLLCAECTA